MRILKNIFSQLHRFILWALILSLLWCWIYTIVDNAPREKKVVFYTDAYALEPRALSLRLEDENMPEGIKMIQATSYDNDLFGGAMVGDFYILRESNLRAALADTPERLTSIELPSGMEGYEQDGKIWGIRIFDAETQQGAAERYIQYTPYPEPEPECYYLCFDASSPHLAALPAALDNAAWEVAMTLLSIRD